MRLRLFFFSSIGFVAMTGCGLGGSDPDSDVRLRTGLWIKAFHIQTLSFSDAAAAGGPLATMCAQGYTPRAGCSISCSSADPGTGLFLSATYTCSGNPQSESGIWEAQCGTREKNGFDHAIDAAITVDSTTREVKVVWNVSGGLWRLPLYVEYVGVGKKFVFKKTTSDTAFQFSCDPPAEITVDNAPEECQAFKQFIDPINC